MKTFAEDIATIESIAAVPTILDVVCRITGMGFAAIARVTDERWIACSVLDHISFGLKSGGELELETTICHEIRQSQKPVIISHVALDEIYRDHHTPRRYGFQSYISMPIFLTDGRFFGTLCCIDPKPANINRPEVVETFRLFVELIAFHFDAAERLVKTESKVLSLEETVQQRTFKLQETILELEAYSHSISHDMRSPLRAMHGYADLLLEEHADKLDPEALDYVQRIHRGARQLDLLVREVLNYSKVTKDEVDLQPIDLEVLIADVIERYPDLHPSKLRVEVKRLPTVMGHRALLTQIVSNVLGNAVKFARPGKFPEVKIFAESADDRLKVCFEDNGIGIESRHHQQIFKIFGRVHSEEEYEGTGIGLAIVKRSVERMGGRVGVDSEPGQGSCFWFTLQPVLQTVADTTSL